jgi:hypothetical protein
VTVRSESELLNFLREVECLAALRHPNVVPFLGAVLQVLQMMAGSCAADLMILYAQLGRMGGTEWKPAAGKLQPGSM